ncbi:hypothetical protein D3C80_1984700 [compost metagenome]
MVVKPLEPGQLIGEFLGAQRIAVGQVDGGDPDRAGRLDQGLQVTRLLVRIIAGQAAPHVRQRIFREQGDAVVALLSQGLDVVA